MKNARALKSRRFKLILEARKSMRIIGSVNAESETERIDWKKEETRARKRRDLASRLSIEAIHKDPAAPLLPTIMEFDSVMKRLSAEAEYEMRHLQGRNRKQLKTEPEVAIPDLGSFLFYVVDLGEGHYEVRIAAPEFRAKRLPQISKEFIANRARMPITWLSEDNVTDEPYFRLVHENSTAEFYFLTAGLATADVHGARSGDVNLLVRAALAGVGMLDQ